LSLFDGKVGANNISIADDPTVSNDVFLTAKSLSAEVKLRPLIVSQTLQITSITLEEPQIRLIRGPAGTWNFSSLGKGAAEAKPSGKRAGAPCTGTLTVDKLTIEKGRVVVWTANPAEMPVTYENVNVNITGFSSTTQLPFEVSAGLRRRGELNLNGQCTPMNAGNTATTSLNPYLQFRKLDLAPSGFVSRGTVMAGLTNIGSQTTWIGQVKTTKTLRDEKLSLIVIGAPSTSISISRRSSVSSSGTSFGNTLLKRY